MSESTMEDLGLELSDDAIRKAREGSVLIEITQRRYGIRTGVAQGLVEFRAEAPTKEEQEQEAEGKERTVKVAKVNRELVTVRKKIFNSPEWSAIKNHDQQTYRYIQCVGLKGDLRQGVYRVPLSLAEKLESYIEVRKGERATLIDTFVGAYETLKAQAQIDLGPAYDEADYHTPSQVRKAFHLESRFLNEDAPANLKAVSITAYQKAEQQAKRQVERELVACVMELRTGFAGLMQHIAERLTPDEEGNAKTFKEASLENIREFLGLFDQRNIAGDTHLAALVKRTRETLTGITAKELRANPDKMQVVRSSFASITQGIDSMLKDKSSRAIGRLEE